MERCMLPHKHFYECLKKAARKKQIKDVLKNAKQKEIKSLCECTLNITNGNIPISRSRFKALEPYKKKIHNLVFKKTALKKKQKYLVQHGKGFLPIIASIAASLISQLVQNQHG